MNRLCTLILLIVALASPVHAAFKHPGILHTADDLARMKQMVAKGKEPWKSGFDLLKSDEQSQSDYSVRGPFERAGRGPNSNEHVNEIMHDCNAAYQNALMWAITGDEAHAKKAVEILNAWSYTHKQETGQDVQLGAGLWGFKFASAAEILRYTYPKWEEKDVKQTEKMLREVFYPPIKDFATFANGNWDGACIKTTMAIGVFCDDQEMFDRGVDYFYHGKGDGRLTNYVFDEEGQCQESGRDQAHTQLGLGLLCEACEIGWNQGLDMYGAENNRLLKGFEYTAKYNLGEDVPFAEHIDTTGKYHHTQISTDGRGKFRPVCEMAWNHYHNRRGLQMPETQRVLEKIRPEGVAWTSDHPGFGTILFTRPFEPTTRPASAHPRILVTPDERAAIKAKIEQSPWAQKSYQALKARIDPLVEKCQGDPKFMSSRLFMNWQTHYTVPIVANSKWVGGDGNAPVPTPRFGGARDWATKYSAPARLEDLRPFNDKDGKVWLLNKETQKEEWADPGLTGRMFETVNERIIQTAADAAFVYWISGDEKYAKYASEILCTYMDGFAYVQPPRLPEGDRSMSRIIGVTSFEVIHEDIATPIAVSYDFLHDYLVAQGKDVTVIQRA